ncbi:MAG: class I SAM-dependent methyltransferase [Gemmatimonadota bacterium]
MSVFRLTDASTRERETKEYWDKRVERDWNQPLHGLYAVYPDDRLAKADERNYKVLSRILNDRVYDHTHGDSKAVLEVACGYGRYVKQISRWCNKYVGIDFAGQNIGAARDHYAELSKVDEAWLRHFDCSFQVADMLTFKSVDKFDLIFMVSAWSSIEHNSTEVIAHLKTLLKPDGVIAIFEENLYMVIDR